MSGPAIQDPHPPPRPTPPRLSLRRAPALLTVGAVALTFVLAGCGGSKASSSATTAVTAGSASATSVATSVATSIPSSPTTPPTTADLGTGSGSFCGFAGSKLAKAISAASAVAEDPTNLQQVAADYRKYSAALLSSAPSSIKPDLAGLLSFDDKLFALLAQHGYNYAKISPSDIASLEQSESQVTQDAEKVSQYVASSCGIKGPDTPTT